MDKAILVFRFYDAPEVLRDVPADATPEDLGWDPNFPGTMLADLLAMRYGDDDPPKLIEWEGSRCAVWIFAH